MRWWDSNGYPLRTIKGEYGRPIQKFNPYWEVESLNSYVAVYRILVYGSTSGPLNVLTKMAQNSRLSCR